MSPRLVGVGPDRFLTAARRVMARCDELARVTATPGAGIERVYLSPEHARVNRLARALRMPGVATLLRLSRVPARAAGLSELQGFLERGFEAFAALGDGARFVEEIRREEAAFSQALFAGGHG